MLDFKWCEIKEHEQWHSFHVPYGDLPHIYKKTEFMFYTNYCLWSLAKYHKTECSAVKLGAVHYSAVHYVTPEWHVDLLAARCQQIVFLPPRKGPLSDYNILSRNKNIFRKPHCLTRHALSEPCFWLALCEAGNSLGLGGSYWRDPQLNWNTIHVSCKSL